MARASTRAPTADLERVATRTAILHARAVSGGVRAAAGVRRRGGGRSPRVTAGAAVADGSGLARGSDGFAQQTAAADDAADDSALAALDRIGAMVRDGQISVFLDYDGTLAPIAALPDQATMSGSMRSVLGRLADRCPVAVISGRRRTDVARLVGLDTVAYAGSHGFDIQSRRLGHVEHPLVRDFVPDIKAAVDALERRIGAVPGVIVEDKIFVLAVHYRLVDAADMPAVTAALEEVAREHPRLKRTAGKRVHELRPRLDWDKGKAVLWLIETLPLDRRPSVPLYIGDDETDEDAFAAVAETGIGVLVAEEPRPTSARFRLRNPEEVCLFLDRLGQLLERGAE